MNAASGVMRQTALVTVALFATVACGGGVAQTMRPCQGSVPDQFCPTSGTVHVVVTGVEEWTFDAPLDPQGDPSPALALGPGVLQLSFRDRSKLPTDSFRFAGARTTTDPQQVVALMIIHGAGYTTTDGCTLTLTAFDERQIAGSFMCTDMHPLGLDQTSSLLVDATGDFSATP